MALNKCKGGNMYGFVTHTWNPISGRCEHNCSYCYMKRWGELNPVHLNKKMLKNNLSKGETIFVGSGTDMFAENVHGEWIQQVFDYCDKWPEQTFLFQTKNPKRYYEFSINPKHILGTTIETNRWYDHIMGNTTKPIERAEAMRNIKNRKFVTIEPILDFDVLPFGDIINSTNVDWVNIGADSQNHYLPEPQKEKILALKCRIKCKVHLKPNLERIIGKQ